MKRFNEENDGHNQPKKKHKQHHSKGQQLYGSPSPNPNQHNKHGRKDHSEEKQRDTTDYHGAVSKLPLSTTKPGSIPAFTPFSVSKGLPQLPPIKDEKLTAAPFTHRSALAYYNRNTQAVPDMTYERLEFLGDAYIELIASRLIFSRYSHLPAGQQSQLRELLVKNETLAEFSRLYGFEGQVKGEDLAGMQRDVGKGNKGFNKVLGDVFEAYVAAVILSDAEEGFTVAESWLTSLWAPKLLEASKKDAAYAAPDLMHSDTADPLTIYNPRAKEELQQRIVDHATTKLEYEPYKASVELKGDQLGQNRHFIALYLTGYGYERKLLGKGEGKNKVEAGHWAAIEAIYGEAKDVVEECESKLKGIREERRKAKAERVAAKGVERA